MCDSQHSLGGEHPHPPRDRHDGRVTERLGVAWEWLVAPVWWASAAFAAVPAIFSDEMHPSNPFAWAFIVLAVAFGLAPMGVRWRRIYRENNNRHKCR